MSTYQKAVIPSPHGPFEIIGSPKGIRSVKKLEEEKPITKNIPESLQACAKQLQEYFAGKRTTFDLTFDFEGASDFNIKVWKALLEVPYGHTTTYAALAEKVGSPKGFQAVGLANKYNPIAIIVPCHRCIGKNGNLTGYFYGLDMKRALLQMENPKSFGVQGSLF